MKFNLNLYLIFAHVTLVMTRNIICYYDASSGDRKGLGKFTLEELEKSMAFCSHVVYAYAGINSLSFQITSLNSERDIERGHFAEVIKFKIKYPHVKFLLSLGGGKDVLDLDASSNNKYLQLLEAGVETQQTFIDSTLNLLRNYRFDGLDLAYQFPVKKTFKSVQDMPWKSFRKLFLNKLNETNFEAEDHKKQFSVLVANMKQAFKPYDFIISLTVLPHVNASLYLNGSALINHLDFINLQTFDFHTPELNPFEASYTAPLYAVPIQGDFNSHHCVDHQVNYWISQQIPLHKINIGIAAYGRAWRMTNHSQKSGFPTVMATNGSAAASYVSNIPGVMTWTEICVMLPNAFNINKTGDQAPLLSVLDPHKDFVTYAFRPADFNGDHGIWISYDDPRIAAIKAVYVNNRNLGGIAMYDINLDDFHGICNGDTFPMLRYIKYVFS